jgi:hypothetical protein
MGVQSTSKTLNRAIGSNNVNGTFLSSPGFNGRYLGELPGILKLLSLILGIISLALVASQREDMRLQIFNKDPFSGSIVPNNSMTHPKELFLSGEVYFLCAHTALLTILVIFLVTYLFHALSTLTVPAVSIFEMVCWMVFALMIMAAGIVEIVQTETWKWDPDVTSRPLMNYEQEAIRDAAGALAVINGIVLFVMYVIAKKEYNGPHQDMGGVGSM